MSAQANRDPEHYTKAELVAMVNDAARISARTGVTLRDRPLLRQRCVLCGRTMKALRRSKRYCGEACRKAAQRARKRAAEAGVLAEDAARELDGWPANWRELAGLDRLG